jgi:hypothetical protein
VAVQISVYKSSHDLCFENSRAIHKLTLFPSTVLQQGVMTRLPTSHTTPLEVVISNLQHRGFKYVCFGCKHFGSCQSNENQLVRWHHETTACRKPAVPNDEQGVFVTVLQFTMVANRTKAKVAATSRSHRPPQGIFAVLSHLQVNSK